MATTMSPKSDEIFKWAKNLSFLYYIETSNQNSGSIESASSCKHCSTFDSEEKLQISFFFLFSVFFSLHFMRFLMLLLQFMISIRDMKRKRWTDRSSVEGISSLFIVLNFLIRMIMVRKVSFQILFTCSIITNIV